jgi:hypothetical protein
VRRVLLGFTTMGDELEFTAQLHKEVLEGVLEVSCISWRNVLIARYSIRIWTMLFVSSLTILQLIWLWRLFARSHLSVSVHFRLFLND